MNSREPDVVVIGAGPYGLAAASHLLAHGFECRVFGTPMAGWSNHMPRGMFLNSTILDSDISAPVSGYGLADFCRERDITFYDADGGERPIPVDAFIDYGRWFQGKLVPHVERAPVRRVEQRPEGFRVELATGKALTTANVVVSVGVAPFAYTPPELYDPITRVVGSPTSGHVSHSADHADLSGFARQRVAVVGGGQSACETAVLLHEAGATVHVIVRTPPLHWAEKPGAGKRKPAAPLGAGWSHRLVTRHAAAYRRLPEAVRLRMLDTIPGPSGSWWLRERFTDAIDVRRGRQVRRTFEHDDGVEMDLMTPDGGSEVLEVDRVIAATGYRVDVSRMDALDRHLAAKVATSGGYPRLSPTGESSVPGLFFSGLAAAGSFGPVLRFVAGTDLAARKVTDGVAGRVSPGRAHPAPVILDSSQDSAA